jgi:hypothetical protein
MLDSSSLFALTLASQSKLSTVSGIQHECEEVGGRCVSVRSVLFLLILVTVPVQRMWTLECQFPGSVVE